MNERLKLLIKLMMKLNISFEKASKLISKCIDNLKNKYPSFPYDELLFIIENDFIISPNKNFKTYKNSKNFIIEI
jgi:hypothetical protein